MFSGTATIFNQHEYPDGTIAWFPHVLQKLHLETDTGIILKKTGNTSADKASLHVPYKCVDGVKTITDIYGNELPWFPPKAWTAHGEDELQETITFAPDDFFMVGVWDDGHFVYDADFTDRRNEGFFAWLNAHKDGVYRITAVQAYDIIPHFELIGA